MKISQQIFLGMVVYLFNLPVYAEEAEWTIDTDINFSFDDNLGKAWLPRDTVEDGVTNFDVNVVYDKVINDFFALSMVAIVGGNKQVDIDKLDAYRYGGLVSLRFQTHRGFDAPLYQISLSVEEENVNVDQRDNQTAKLQAFVNRRISDRSSTVLGLEYRNSSADGAVFDMERSRLFASIDYDITHHWSIYGGYSYLQGDAFSSAQRVYKNGYIANEILPLINISTAIERDDAFNDFFPGDWLVYRFEAKAHSFNIGANYGLNGSTSIDFSVRYSDVTSDADGDISYDTTVSTISLLKRF